MENEINHWDSSCWDNEDIKQFLKFKWKSIPKYSYDNDNLYYTEKCSCLEAEGFQVIREVKTDLHIIYKLYYKGIKYDTTYEWCKELYYKILNKINKKSYYEIKEKLNKTYFTIKRIDESEEDLIEEEEPIEIEWKEDQM